MRAGLADAPRHMGLPLKLGKGDERRKRGASGFLLPRIGWLTHCSRRAFCMLHCYRILSLFPCRRPEEAHDCDSHLQQGAHPRLTSEFSQESRHSFRIRSGLLRRRRRRFQPPPSFFSSVSSLARKYWMVDVKSISSSLNLTCLAGKVAAAIRACIVLQVCAAF